MEFIMTFLCVYITYFDHMISLCVIFPALPLLKYFSF